MAIIALSGYARSGKDTIADHLESLGWHRAAFAQTLRASLEALNPIITSSDEGFLRYRDILGLVGYEAGKEIYPEFRELLQRMGTEVGRNLLGQNIWVEATMKSIQEAPSGTSWVLTDCRFPNEFEAVKAAGGSVWRVVRPGIEAANQHPSEVALDAATFDAVLLNDSTIEVLFEQVDYYLGLL